MKIRRNRKKYVWSVACLTALLGVSCSGNRAKGNGLGKEVVRIAVAEALEHPSELKVSDLGSDVRLVALETTDSSLVPGDPTLMLLDAHIVVYTEKDCLLFDKASGRFLGRVGQVDQGPEGATYASPFYDAAEGKLLFKRVPDVLQVYDLEGRYQGKRRLPTQVDPFVDWVSSTWGQVGYRYSLFADFPAYPLVFSDASGCLVDSVPQRLSSAAFSESRECSVMHLMDLGLSAGLQVTCTNGDRLLDVVSNDYLWKRGEEVRWKETFSDTIYQVTRQEVRPTAYFDLDEAHWGMEARTQAEAPASRMLVTALLDSPQALFFQCVRGVFQREPEVFNGVYHYATGTTRLAPEQNGLVYDGLDFPPFRPSAVSAKGEFGMLLQAADALEWLDEQGNEPVDDRFSVLGALHEEDNPVVVIVSPKPSIY